MSVEKSAHGRNITPRTSRLDPAGVSASLSCCVSVETLALCVPLTPPLLVLCMVKPTERLALLLWLFEALAADEPAHGLAILHYCPSGPAWPGFDLPDKHLRNIGLLGHFCRALWVVKMWHGDILYTPRRHQTNLV